MSTKFTVWVGAQRLLFKRVEGEEGVTHHLIVGGELMRCNFHLAEGNTMKADQPACLTGALSTPNRNERK